MDNVHMWQARTNFVDPVFWVPFYYGTQVISGAAQMLIFFGIVMRGFSYRLRRHGSGFCTAMFYALWQYEQPVEVFIHFFIGLFFSFIVMRTGSVYVVMICRFAISSFTLLVMSIWEAWPAFFLEKQILIDFRTIFTVDPLGHPTNPSLA